jgi:hypothetical protein
MVTSYEGKYLDAGMWHSNLANIRTNGLLGPRSFGNAE